ncbi:hypothetical protein RJ640_004320, partial [Escallonia rubra]
MSEGMIVTSRCPAYTPSISQPLYLMENDGNNLQGDWIFSDGSEVRPILYVTDVVNPPFAFGFFGNGTAVYKSFYLSVFSLSTFITTFPYSFTDSNLNTSSSGNATIATIASSPASTNRSTGFDINLNSGPIVVWSANRDRPVGENATLDFTPEGNLELKDADGTFVWSTNTSSLSVLCLNLTTGGNLILVDGKNSVIWQSFDYPTDTWLPNQNIPVGKKLVASKSSSNLAPGMYYLSVTSHGIYAFITSEFDPPKMYSTLLSGSDMFHSALGINGRIDSNTNYARFNLESILETGFHYIKLEINGHLNGYRLNKFDEYGYDVIFSGDLLKDFDYGFGSVFEGDLADGTKVAVKRLDSTGQGRKEFMAEVNTIWNIHHFNLVRL